MKVVDYHLPNVGDIHFIQQYVQMEQSWCIVICSIIY